MNALVPLPVVLPLGGAAVSILFGRYRNVQRAISLSVLAATLVISVVLLCAPTVTTMWRTTPAAGRRISASCSSSTDSPG